MKFDTTNKQADTSKQERRYMPGIDGLRALAVLAVIAYHLQLGWAQGGLLGVGVFFVLSGYLITDILAEQWRFNGKFDLKQFWLGRARRLLPAMFVMIAGVTAWLSFFGSERLPALKGDITASVLYVMNWWFVYHKVSYFESFGPPSPLGHLWSLAVEEQFYLIWPLLFALGLRFVPSKSKLLVLTFTGIAASAIAMALLYEPGSDPSRVYYGTDTRAFALLIGAALAMVWPSRKLSAGIKPQARLLLDLVGLAGLSVVLVLIWQTNEYDEFLYRGGMVLLSFAAAVTVAILAHPASILAKLLGCKPLKWLGVRSYGIYLWHYPVITLTSPSVQTGSNDIQRAIMQVLLSIVLAALSYRLIEEPIRRGSFKSLWKRRSKGKEMRGFRPGRLWVSTVCALIALIVLGGGLTGWFPVTTASVVSVAPPNSTDDPVSSVTSNTYVKPSKTPIPTSQATGGQSHTPTPSPTPNLGNALVDDSLATRSGKGITVIGDSVILDVAPHLEKLLPGIVIEGKIGRQMSQAAGVVEQLQADGKLGDRIVIELGTNGAFSRKQLDSLLRSLKNVQQVVLINTRVPRPWESEVNTTLADAAGNCANVTLVDWHEASTDQISFFYGDGVHLNDEGSEFYAAYLAKAIELEK